MQRNPRRKLASSHEVSQTAVSSAADATTSGRSNVEVACAICGEEGLFRKTDAFEADGIKGHFLRCPSCEVEFADPPTYNPAVYDNFYENYAPLDWTIRCPSEELGHRSERLLYPAHRQLIEYSERLPRSTRILDVGCGTGWVLSILRRRGFSNLVGLEIVPAVADAVRQKGISVLLGSIESCPEDLRPDLVIISEVLEHLPDPVGFLRTIRIRLGPALLLATTPNRDRWAVRLRIRRLGDWPTGHIIRWSAKGLRKAFERAGYSAAEITATAPDGREVWLQILSYLTQGGKRGRRWRQKFPSRLSALLLHNVDRTVPIAGIVLWPIARILRLFGFKGRSWVIVAHVSSASFQAGDQESASKYAFAGTAADAKIAGG